jgi:multidrug efflux pump subunit AcrA (membrane-fusion protein)
VKKFFLKSVYFGFLALMITACTEPDRPTEEKFDVFEIVEKDLTESIEITADVQVRNTIEVIVPIRGRIEEIYVKEGEFVRKGQRLGAMSSTNRVNMLDMAAHKGQDEVKYWEKQILPTYIFSPIDGKVIAISLRQGETGSGRFLKLSTGLVVRGNVDEIDVPELKIDQNVRVNFDVKPEEWFASKLIKIDQESKKVSNVNVYEVEVAVPEEAMLAKNVTPKIGMSANILFPTSVEENALAIKATAVNNRSNQKFSVLNINNQKITLELGDTYGEWVHVKDGGQKGQKIKVPVFSISKQNTKKSPLSFFK